MKVRQAELFLNSCLFIAEQRRYTCCVLVAQCDRNAEKGWKPPAPGDRFLGCKDGDLIVGGALVVSS